MAADYPPHSVLNRPPQPDIGLGVDEEGRVAQNPQDAENLAKAGYTKCYNQLCDYYISPEAASAIDRQGGLYKCPHCGMQYNLLGQIGQMPTHFAPGGRTIAGVSLAKQAQIGEDLVESLGSIPGYGSLVWWHTGGATSASPLDGATAEWGLEVKTINADAKNLRFIPGRTYEKADKNNHAADMGKRGVLGVLVLLNYRNSLADIYVREMTLDPWTAGNGKQVAGVAAFRHKDAYHLVAELPFDNPLVDPSDPAPEVAGANAPSISDDIPF